MAKRKTTRKATGKKKRGGGGIFGALNAAEAKQFTWVKGFRRGPCKIKGFKRDGAKVRAYKRATPKRPNDGIPF